MLQPPVGASPFPHTTSDEKWLAWISKQGGGSTLRGSLEEQLSYAKRELLTQKRTLYQILCRPSRAINSHSRPHMSAEKHVKDSFLFLKLALHQVQVPLEEEPPR